MSVELYPADLGFKRPFTREVVQTLRIRNPNFDPVAFKVKTTAPKQYCVRPNSGRIEAGKDVEVQVLLQAMKEDPPPDAKCRDKFLVQSVQITADREAVNVAQIWSHVEKNEKSAIQEKKIKVLFLPADHQENGGPSDNIPDSSPPPYAALQDAQSEQRGGPTIKKEESDAGSMKGQEYHASSHTTGGGVDWESKLADAEATIAKLKNELRDQGLRLRKTAGVATDAVKDKTVGGNTAGALQTTHAPEGIPVQICAALCLAAFLIAWFFF